MTDLRLWLIMRTDATLGVYDIYDSAVVCASSEEGAKMVHPGGEGARWGSSDWVKGPDQVEATEIGVAAPGMATGVVLASFNAG